MAYTALVSLMQTIDGLQNNSSHISLLPSDEQILQSTYDEAECLKEVLQILDKSSNHMDGYGGYLIGGSTSYYFVTNWVTALTLFEPRLSIQFPSEYRILHFGDEYREYLSHLQDFLDKRVNVLDGRIREAVHDLHRVLESIVSEFTEPIESISVDLDEAMQEIDVFIQTVNEIVNEEKDSREEEEEDDDDGVSLQMWGGQQHTKWGQDKLYSAPLVDDVDNDDDYGNNNVDRDDDDIKSNLKMDQFWEEFPETCEMTREIMTLVSKVAFKLESFIQRMDKNRTNKSSERLHALDGDIREAARKLEDALEDHVSDQFRSQSDRDLTHHPLSLISLDLKKIEEDINSFNRSSKKLKDEYIDELRNPLAAGQEGDEFVPSRIDFVGINKSRINMVVGLSDDVDKIKGLLIKSSQRNGREIYAVVGMAGIGKTTLAREVFEDESILNHFERRAWVTVGPKYQLKDILRSILVQVSSDESVTIDGDETLNIDGDKILEMKVSESLYGRRHLIVLDDVWDTQLYAQLRWLLPSDDNGSRVMLTTRIGRVASGATYIEPHEMRFLNNDESWDLLSDKIFGDQCKCPPHLETAGKKIAENCEGLPLTIVTVADILSKADKTAEYWNEVAEKQQQSLVFVDAYDQMSKALFPSYNYLPQHLKVWFYYMGVFPQKYEILCSKLIMLLSAEKLLEPISSLDVSSAPPRMETSVTLEKFAMYCLEELVCTNVVLVRKKNHEGEMKTCSLHSAFWHLCIKEAGKNKFSHVVNSYADGLALDIKGQRRLCIHNNVLFGIKDVHNSMASISNVHSLLCTGKYHHYPVPICFGLRLLRVLDALTIRFYKFPLEVIKLVELRYLALTCHEKLPASIHKLWNLEFLIVRRHLEINFSKCPAYLPMEIWDMQELKHLQIMGSNLPDRPSGAFLANLSTLLDVGPQSCSKNILEGLPNLKKLGIRIELAPDASDRPLRCLDHVSKYLNVLKSLKCIIMNPQVMIRSEVISPCAPIANFPTRLKRLSLSGMGYPWEDMRVIASLPKLEVLKLRCFAFRGPKWEVKAGVFRRLKYLLIEDTDLVHWTIDNDSFRSLKRLFLKHCYRLEEIPLDFGYSRAKVDVVDCNMLAVKKMKEDGMEGKHWRFDVNVLFSWNDTVNNLES